MQTANRTIDHEIVAELKALGDEGEPSFFIRQVRLFLARAHDQLTQLDVALAKNRPGDEAVRCVHALAGSAAVIGASRLSDLCLDFEERQHEWPRERRIEAAESIHVEFAAAEAALLAAAHLAPS